MTFSISVNRLSLDELIHELGERATEAARPAAHAASEVLYQDVKRNAARIHKKTGNLQSGVYQVYSKKQSREGHATYHVSWNPRKAPHGGLIEFGHIMRYASYVGSDGNFYTLVRPEMRGKKKPSRRAPQSVKDAYYVRLPVPLQIAAQPFVRPALAKMPQALAAAEDVLRKLIR